MLPWHLVILRASSRMQQIIETVRLLVTSMNLILELFPDACCHCDKVLGTLSHNIIAF